MKELGEKIKKCRLEKGITQEQAANKLKINRVTYTGYESGKHQPSLEMLIKIADLYKTSTDYLLGRYE